MRMQASGIAIEVDDQGPRDAAPLLLIMGLGMQLIDWPDALVRLLVDRGFRVIRIDNRDAGLSHGHDDLGVPNMAALTLRYVLRLPLKVPYRIADMAGDALGVIDALGLQTVHVCGASMGGMIAQHLAAGHPDRVASLVLMMTTSGARSLPQASLRVRAALLKRPDGSDPESAVEHLRRVLTLIGSPGYPADPDRLRERLRVSVRRAWRPAGTARQLAAVAADGNRSPLLSRIVAPTLVIHGAGDPLVPVAAAHDLVGRIAGAQLDLVPGMGHDLPEALLARFADGIAANAKRS
ncbi:MAG: alpha/beta fold hydrolase [Burkholderiaceae bacterium]